MVPEERGSQFHAALAQLQALHEAQVATLAAEVGRLRGELRADRPPAEAPPHPQQTATPEPEPAFFFCSSGRPSGPSSHGIPPLAIASAARPTRPQSELSEWVAGGKASLLSQAAMKRRTRSRRTVWELPLKGCRGMCAWIVQKQAFDLAMGFVIALNAVCIGIESSISRARQEAPVALTALEYGFIAVYVVELAMRWAVMGARGLANRWIRFDLFLVIGGLLHVASTLVTATPIDILDKVLLVRILRLARLARVFRMMTKFNALWLLVQGLMNSFVALVSTGAIMGILLYIFAVLGMELLQPDPQASEEYTQIVNNHFNGLFNVMLTLLQGLTMDSFSSIYRPMMLEKPYLVLYFVPFMLAVPIALMNLVTAVMVNLSLDQATNDKVAQEKMLAEKREELVDLLKKMFTTLDTDGSDDLDLVEMLNAPDDVKALIFEIAEIGTQGPDCNQDLKEIFRILDFDGRGYVGISEFCDGLLKLQDSNALGTMRFRKMCQSSMDRLANLLTSSCCYIVKREKQQSAGTPPLETLLEHSQPAILSWNTEFGAPTPINNERRDVQQL